MERQDAVGLLRELTVGYRLSQAVYVAAKLGLADRLAQGPRSGEELAAAVEADGPSLTRLLRLLAAAGVFAEVAPERFALAPAGEPLRTGGPGSLRDWIVMTMELEFPAWGQLLHAVATGERGFDRAFGAGYWEHLSRHPDAGATFDAAMVDLSRRQAAAVVAAYDFSGCRVVADVGGGRGALLGAVLAANPHLRGMLFDRPPVVAGAGPTLAAAGVADRCDLVTGDFFEGAPAGADLYMLKLIVHDWDDAPAAAILRRCRDAIGSDGKLLLVERVVPAGLAAPQHLDALRQDVHMMVLFRGRERTEQQFGALLAAAGLRLERVVPTASELSILEASPVP